MHKVYNIDSSKSFKQTNVKNEFSFIGIIPKYRGIINRFIWREKIKIFFLYICQMWEYFESSETIKLELRRKNRN